MKSQRIAGTKKKQQSMPAVASELTAEENGGPETWTPFYGGPIPMWDEREPPDSVTMFSFAIKQLALLASSCPAFDVRKAAAEFLAKEFAPPRGENLSEKDRFIVTLRQEIERFRESGDDEIELEASETTERQALPAANDTRQDS